MNRSIARSLAVLAMAMMSFMTASAMTSTNASAAGVSGTWVSATAGEGFVTEGYYNVGPYTWHYDVKMTLSQSGNYVSGQETITVRTVDNNPGYAGWPAYPYPMGESFTYQVDGTFDGSTLELTVYASDYALEFTLTVSGNSMSGDGLYESGGVTMIGIYDLKKESGFGSIGFGGSSTTNMVLVVVIVIAVVSFAVSSVPVRVTPPGTPPQGFQPVQTKVPSKGPDWQPAEQWTTETAPQPITGEQGVPVGGVGLHYAPPPPSGGPPAPPRDYFSNVSQDPPKCPHHHDTALVPHYKSAEGSDRGSWYCPKCKLYPWGRS